jgi:flavin-dependent thymidylate synthase
VGPTLRLYCKTPMAEHHGEGTCYDRGEEPGDEKLLKYLWDNEHASPFEMAGRDLEVKAPIFVLREWMRHRTQSFNEMSARYVPLPNENYVPTAERLRLTDDKNKQAQGQLSSGPRPLTGGWRA